VATQTILVLAAAAAAVLAQQEADKGEQEPQDKEILEAMAHFKISAVAAVAVAQAGLVAAVVTETVVAVALLLQHIQLGHRQLLLE
jgi:TRAP-type uncharacterized transport system fused permease subunit